MSAIYEYGGLTSGCLDLSSPKLFEIDGDVERTGRKSKGDGETGDEGCILLLNF